jgi:anthranilate phosphoribosyltransferase
MKARPLKSSRFARPREKAVLIRLDARYQADTCGTGGDMAHTFNISTTAALLSPLRA